MIKFFIPTLTNSKNNAISNGQDNKFFQIIAFLISFYLQYKSNSNNPYAVDEKSLIF